MTDREQWELDVFNNATYFTVIKPGDNGWRQEHRSFITALSVVAHDERCLVYAVNEQGRSVCVDRALWPNRIIEWSQRMMNVACDAVFNDGEVNGRDPAIWLEEQGIWCPAEDVTFTRVKDALLEYGCLVTEADAIARSVSEAREVLYDDWKQRHTEGT